MTPGAPPEDAEAIVALTGGSMERLETGVRLLKEGHGERLLISGVNRDVADHELFELLGVPDDLARCCVDLGRGAEDTLGNASETAEWAHRRHFSHLILVTDDYHMPRSKAELSIALPDAEIYPRSKAELSIALPDAEIYPYPVRTRYTDPALWRSDLAAASRLGSEYVKYLMIRGREALISFSEKHDDAPDGADSHA